MTIPLDTLVYPVSSIDHLYPYSESECIWLSATYINSRKTLKKDTQLYISIKALDNFVDLLKFSKAQTTTNSWLIADFDTNELFKNIHHKSAVVFGTYSNALCYKLQK